MTGKNVRDLLQNKKGGKWVEVQMKQTDHKLITVKVGDVYIIVFLCRQFPIIQS